MSLRKFLKDVFNPSSEEININEAKNLVSKLMSNYSVEEQSSILLEAKNELVSKRKDQIKDAENFINRLKADLEKIEKTS